MSAALNVQTKALPVGLPPVQLMIEDEAPNHRSKSPELHRKPRAEADRQVRVGRGRPAVGERRPRARHRGLAERKGRGAGDDRGANGLDGGDAPMISAVRAAGEVRRRYDTMLVANERR